MSTLMCVNQPRCIGLCFGRTANTERLRLWMAVRSCCHLNAKRNGGRSGRFVSYCVSAEIALITQPALKKEQKPSPAEKFCHRVTGAVAVTHDGIRFEMRSPRTPFLANFRIARQHGKQAVLETTFDFNSLRSQRTG
jgi:hypothetical protein